MVLSDEHVASLRGFLAFEPDEGVRLTGQLAQTGDLQSYGVLIYAAFVTAVRRRFSPTWTVPEVIGFVASVRARLLGDVEIDPRAAGLLMRRALGDSVTGDLDDETKARAQVFVLAELIADEQLDASGLDQFMSQARALADRLIS
ncbi:MAG: hypothetical protein JWP48_2431 [Actinoallomurus sp.]|jgi:hypothetical protein|nr:hypothetical protein [Actinoallomurus sp.]